MKSIFDPSFRYKPSFETDVRKTFERIRKEQQLQGRRGSAAANSGTTVKVLTLDQKKQRTG
jgi:hypothetical protein